MPILSPRNDYRWPIQAREMRELLGFKTNRIPDDAGEETWQIQGYNVHVFTRRFCQYFTKARKPHRIYVKCKGCRRWIPFGRLAQHERACPHPNTKA